MKTLIIVDVQNDFCPGGSLAVNRGDRIIPMINKLSNSGKFDRIIATQDWHPKGHMSFASTYRAPEFIKNEKAGQIVWPDHCVQMTVGAELRPSLDTSNVTFIVRKGMNIGIDSYSAFFDNGGKATGIEDLFTDNDDIYVVGIATEVCVLNTAIDALNRSRTVTVFEDAIAGITEDGSETATMEMLSAGIIVQTAKNYLEG